MFHLERKDVDGVEPIELFPSADSASEPIEDKLGRPVVHGITGTEGSCLTVILNHFIPPEKGFIYANHSRVATVSRLARAVT